MSRTSNSSSGTQLPTHPPRPAHAGVCIRCRNGVADRARLSARVAFVDPVGFAGEFAWEFTGDGRGPSDAPLAASRAQGGTMMTFSSLMSLCTTPARKHSSHARNIWRTMMDDSRSVRWRLHAHAQTLIAIALHSMEPSLLKLKHKFECWQQVFFSFGNAFMSNILEIFRAIRILL